MENQNTQTEEKLKRKLGLFDGVNIMAGIIIGSGIFYTLADVLSYSNGNTGLTIVAWIIGGLMCLGGALCFAELGTMMPETGGTYYYISRIYKKIGPIVAFTQGWADTLLAIPAANIAIAMVGATYIGSLFGGFSAFQISCLSAAIAVIVSIVNIMGAKIGSLVNSVLMVIKVGAILAVIVLCYVFGQNTGDPITFQNLAETSGSPFSAIVFSVVAVLWCFDGWNSISLMAGELKNPKKNIPRVMIITLVAITGIYLLFNLSIMYVAPVEEIMASENITYDVVTTLLGKGAATILTVCIICSVLGSFVGSCMVYPRMIYAMACDNRWFPIFKKVSKKSNEPIVADIYVMIMMVFYAFASTVRDLVNICTLKAWIYFLFIFIGVLVMRKTSPDAERAYKVPFGPVIPVIMIVFSTVMLIANFVMNPVTLVGLLIPLSGVPGYFAFKAYNKKRGRPFGIN
ncbi:APC family permease [uncultured Ruthenibacterium sp.]|uniref:APC family permease n=1 Tax=uncultured Ruthenibacterium sp. TaxID=1905347 RepID=UPI00349ED6F4